MANTRDCNVIRVDTDATFAESLIICGIRYIAGTSGSVVIKAESASGVTLYENDNSADEFNEVFIRAPKGVNVNVEGTGTVVYLYCK
jgi:hypothetical protein